MSDLFLNAPFHTRTSDIFLKPRKRRVGDMSAMRLMSVNDNSSGQRSLQPRTNDDAKIVQQCADRLS